MNLSAERSVLNKNELKGMFVTENGEITGENYMKAIGVAIIEFCNAHERDSARNVQDYGLNGSTGKVVVTDS